MINRINCPECNAPMNRMGIIVRRSGLRERFWCPKCGKSKSVILNEHGCLQQEVSDASKAR